MAYDKGPKCGFCGNLGHRAENCPKLKEHNKQAMAARERQEVQNLHKNEGC